MKRKQIIIAATAVCVLNVISAGNDFMGPPSANLNKGRLRAGAEYSYSRMDIALTDGSARVNWATSAQADRISLNNVKMNKVYGILGYGITDQWEIFGRLGGTNISFSEQNFLEPSPPTNICAECGDENEFNGGTGAAVGVGTKVTFHERDNLKWGGLFQISWAKSSGTEHNSISLPNSQWTQRYEIDATLTEIQLAVGPTYKPVRWLSLYGGPFLHFIDGHLETDYNQTGQVPGPATVAYNGKYRYDIDQEAFFGGYLGALFDVATGVSFGFEYQHTAASDALAMALIGRF